MAMNNIALHRVRRLRWQASAPSAGDAFALRSLLRRQGDAVSAAIEEALAALDLPGEVWHLPALKLRLDASSLSALDAELPALVAMALRAALLKEARPADVALPEVVAAAGPVPGSASSASIEASAHAALRHYLGSGNLPWPLAGLSFEAQQQALHAAAQKALEALLQRGSAVALAELAEILGPSEALPRRLGVLLRWLALLPPAQRQRWLAHSPPPAGIAVALAEAWFALLASSAAPLEWAALWLLWPTLQDLHAPAATRGKAIAALHMPTPGAAFEHLAAALLEVLGQPASMDSATPPAPAPTQARLAQAWPTAATPDSQLVPLAGLVLLHPYLPRFLKGCGLVNEKTGRPSIDDAALPRACALLHGLACGDAEAAEHQLPLIKLLLGRSPDEALTAALPRLGKGDVDEVDDLLGAVRGHWKSLGSSSSDVLRLSFLQRSGLLRKADGAWQLQMQAESFDLLLALLPWPISLVKLPWMAQPLMVEWHAP
jgi:hypothetical protein